MFAYRNVEVVVVEPLIDIFCPCVILSAISGYWDILLIVIGGIA